MLYLEVVPLLDLKHRWLDKLCVHQTDMERKAAELSFSSAFLPFPEGPIRVPLWNYKSQKAIYGMVFGP